MSRRFMCLALSLLAVHCAAPTTAPASETPAPAPETPAPAPEESANAEPLGPAPAIDGGVGTSGEWEGTGVTRDLTGAEIARFRVSLRRSASGQQKEHVEGTITFPDGRTVPFWQDLETYGVRAFRERGRRRAGRGWHARDGSFAARRPRGAQCRSPRPMTRLRVLLVDDEPPARERLRRLLSTYEDIECVGEAGDGPAALEEIDRLRPDLVFLDVQMPEMDGMAVAAALSDSGPSVIFATAFEQHAVRAFEHAAVDYLLKPIDKARLADAIARVRKQRTSGRELARAVLEQIAPGARKMAVRCGAKYLVFDVERISAIVAQDHYSAIVVGDREHLSDDPLDRLFERLSGGDFLRVHRSAILNVRFVEELVQEGDRKYVAVLSDERKTRIGISRDRVDALKARLGIG